MLLSVSIFQKFRCEGGARSEPPPVQVPAPTMPRNTLGISEGRAGMRWDGAANDFPVLVRRYAMSTSTSWS